MRHCTSPPRGVTGIKPHYRRLLELEDWSWYSEEPHMPTIPQNKPATDLSLHRLPASYFLCLILSVHSLIPLSLYVWESVASYFPTAFWDQAERKAERAVLSKSRVVLIECIILLMLCHCSRTLKMEVQLLYMYVLHKVSKNREKQCGFVCRDIKTITVNCDDAVKRITISVFLCANGKNHSQQVKMKCELAVL